jgi:hypothetical protein
MIVSCHFMFLPNAKARVLPLKQIRENNLQSPMLRHSSVLNCFICFKVRICHKLKP